MPRAGPARKRGAGPAAKSCWQWRAPRRQPQRGRRRRRVIRSGRRASARVGLAGGMWLPLTVVLGPLAPFDAIRVFCGFPTELLVLGVGPDVGDRLVVVLVCHARRSSRSPLDRHLPSAPGAIEIYARIVATEERRDASSRDQEQGSSDDRLPALVVSACLLGVPCNHRGGSSPSPAVAALAADHRLVPVCPEVAGGLATPRVAAERQPDGRVMSADGSDVTDAYRRGAMHAVDLARSVGAQRAVLKARSPSCGCSTIYDGTFTRTLTSGAGVTAEALREAGLEVCSEEDLELTRDRRAAPDSAGSSAGEP